MNSKVEFYTNAIIYKHKHFKDGTFIARAFSLGIFKSDRVALAAIMEARKKDKYVTCFKFRRERIYHCHEE